MIECIEERTLNIANAIYLTNPLSCHISSLDSPSRVTFTRSAHSLLLVFESRSNCQLERRRRRQHQMLAFIPLLRHSCLASWRYVMLLPPNVYQLAALPQSNFSVQTARCSAWSRCLRTVVIPRSVVVGILVTSRIPFAVIQSSSNHLGRACRLSSFVECDLQAADRY